MCPKVDWETLLPNGFFENGPRMPERFRRVRTTDVSDPASLLIIIDAYLDDPLTREMSIFRSPTNTNFLERPMTDSFEESLAARAGPMNLGGCGRPSIDPITPIFAHNY